MRTRTRRLRTFWIRLLTSVTTVTRSPQNTSQTWPPRNSPTRTSTPTSYSGQNLGRYRTVFSLVTASRPSHVRACMYRKLPEQSAPVKAWIYAVDILAFTGHTCSGDNGICASRYMYISNFKCYCYCFVFVVRACARVVLFARSPSPRTATETSDAKWKLFSQKLLTRCLEISRERECIYRILPNTPHVSLIFG